jgi:hypothetical protein
MISRMLAIAEPVMRLPVENAALLPKNSKIT